MLDKHAILTKIYQNKAKNTVGNYMFKVNNRNSRIRCEICSKLTIKTPVSLLLALNIFYTFF